SVRKKGAARPRGALSSWGNAGRLTQGGSPSTLGRLLPQGRVRLADGAPHGGREPGVHAENRVN
ncbi:MAG: hypothetical protein ACE5HE_12650, partial [Phycisphaerae bacterium]